MKIKVGKVLKAQGIRGELKVACFLDDAAMLKHAKQLYLNNNLHKVSQIRADGAFFYVHFEDITDRNSAESFRDWEIFCDKENLSLSEGRYFISDIIGCRVTLDDGRTVGEICEVLQYGAADVYVCKTDGPDVLFPALKDLLLVVDIVAKKIVLSAKRFEEVSVFDED